VLKILKKITKRSLSESKVRTPDWLIGCVVVLCCAVLRCAVLIPSCCITLTHSLTGSKRGHVCCFLEDVKPSPVLEGYRNKLSLTIGYSHTDADGKRHKVVGFAAGRIEAGVTTVGKASECLVASAHALQIVELFQQYIDSSSWEPFCKIKHTGHWRVMTLRTFSTGDGM
jgi:hypothetical protein